MINDTKVGFGVQARTCPPELSKKVWRVKLKLIRLMPAAKFQNAACRTDHPFTFFRKKR